MTNPFRRKDIVNSDDIIVARTSSDSVIIDSTGRNFSGREASGGGPTMFMRDRTSNSENLYVNRLIVNRSNMYHDQFFRTFHSVLDDSALRDFSNNLDLDEVNIHPGSAFANVTSNVAKLANRFIAPNMSIDKKRDLVPIANGFGEARFVFIMEIEKTIHDGIKEIYIVTGFTDRCDVTYDRANNDIVYIDPKTEFYINNVITLTETDGRMNGYGNGKNVKLRNVQQLLYENPFDDDAYNHAGYTTITPFDIASRLQISHMQDNDVKGITLDSKFRSGANTTRAKSSLKFSRRGNTNVPEYVARLTSGYKSGVQELQQGFSDDFSVWDGIRGKVAEDKIRANHLFSVLRDQTRIEEGKCFTYEELLKISPDVDDVTDVNMGNKRRNNRNTEYHYSSGIEYQMCLRIANAMPSLLTSSSLESITFEVNNYTFNGEWNVLISNDLDLAPRPFKESMDDDKMVNMFLNRLHNEVLNGLVNNDHIPVEIYVEASLLEEIYIEVAVDHERPTPWAMPSFADNQNSPIICRGDSSRFADEIAEDLGHIYNAIGDTDSLPMGRSRTFADFD